jgi:protein disulfide-isomerase A6
LEPSWEKAARILKGVVKVGAANVDVEKSLGQQYQIQGFPTLKFFGFNKKKDPEDYQGQRDAEGIANFAAQKVQQGVRNRLKGKDSSSGSGGSQKSSGGSGSSSGSGSGDEVIVLDQTNFDALVLKSKDIWIVEFYAPWCGHCQALEPEYVQAARNLKGQVKLGKVDATVNEQLAQRFGVRGYPTLKVFDYGADKSDAKAQDYQGERSASAITSYGAGLAEKADVEPDLFELHKQS